MPIYEFICEKCGNNFEELMFNDSLPPCPVCGACQTQRIMSSCCAHTGTSDSTDYGTTSSCASSRSGCAGCSGGSCATCGH